MVLFFAVIGNAIFTFVLDGYGEKKLNLVIHTHKVLTESERLLGAMTNAETGQRGYILTRNSDYLESYHIGILDSKKHLSHLFTLTSDNPKQQNRLQNISALMAKKFSELQKTISLSQENTKDSLQEMSDVVNSNIGKKFMDAIRIEILSFKNDELLLLEHRKGDFKENRAYITMMMLFEIMFFVFMSIITGLFIKSKLFRPIEMLIAGTAKMEKGERQHISDILPNDEMGYLLSRFYQMSRSVHAKTQALSYDASHDPMTGLRNRGKFETELAESMASLSNQEKLAVLFIDLNKFKDQNDSLGHDVGDAILVETAKRLKNSIRSNDAAYRIGGDEFIVIIKEITSNSDVHLVIENMLQKFSLPFIFKGHTITISPSIGIAISPDDSSDSNEILKLSDVAMYAAKQDNNTDYKFFDSTMLNRKSDK